MNSEKTKKIGIFGGTFDPIHYGHLQCAKLAMEKFDLDEVRFMPANIPNFKQDCKISTAKNRSTMLKYALSEFREPAFKIDNLELCNSCVSYTSESLKKLKDIYRKEHLFFICGSDSVSSLVNWHNAEEIFDYCDIIGFSRKGEYTMPNFNSEFLSKHSSQIHYCEGEIMKVSSSEIRKLVSEKKTISGLTTDKVVDFILGHNLYY